MSHTTTPINFPPNHWRRLQDIIYPPGSDNKAATVWEHKIVGLRVLRSISTTKDGKQWIHVSVSRADRIPSWADLSKVKDEFIGEDQEAYQVLASSHDHVNLHSFCLHLWSPIDGVRCVANLHDLTNESAI